MDALLDTCTFLWLAFQPERISASAVAIIDDPGNTLVLSQASVLEIVLKYRVGKLPLPEAPREWIPSRRRFYQLKDLPLGENVYYRSGELPDGHDDPFDRLLAAHALENGLVLLSPDAPLSETLGAPRIW